MSELRWNPLTGRWVCVAPARSTRPIPNGRSRETDLPKRDPHCPFCPGNEDQLPGVLWEIRSEDPPGWRVRAVPNRYPAFAPPSEGGPEDLLRSLPVSPTSALHATGRQEVVIESPRHDANLGTLGKADLEAVVEGHHARYSARAEGDPEGRVLLFRNHRREAGASLVHPHSQLVALSFPPPEVQARERRMELARFRTGRCILCDPNGEGPGRKGRTVAQNDGFRAMVPWAAEVPMEVWLVPRRHQAGFDECTSRERALLAEVLTKVLGAYRTLAGDPAYNYLLHSAPPALKGHPAHHWFIQIRPRPHQLAGFELQAGVVINPSLPESEAEALREAAGSATEIHPRGVRL